MPKEPAIRVDPTIGQPSLQERFRRLPSLPKDEAPEFTSPGIINLEALTYLIDNDIVGITGRHSTAPLSLLNYHKHVENLSAKLNRPDIFTPLTRISRGLIINHDSGENCCKTISQNA